MSKVNYGYDAPGIMRNLIIFGDLIMIAGIIISQLSENIASTYIGYFITVAGVVFFLLGVAMLAYGLQGKYRTRDLMLSKINWTGAEQVLDIGTGQRSDAGTVRVFHGCGLDKAARTRQRSN